MDFCLLSLDILEWFEERNMTSTGMHLAQESLLGKQGEAKFPVCPMPDIIFIVGTGKSSRPGCSWLAQRCIGMLLFTTVIVQILFSIGVLYMYWLLRCHYVDFTRPCLLKRQWSRCHTIHHGCGFFIAVSECLCSVRLSNANNSIPRNVWCMSHTLTFILYRA